MLLRTAFRICACEAISKIGIACDVRDSQIAAYSTGEAPAESRPFVAVYTDEQHKLSIVIGITANAGELAADGENEVVDTGLAQIPVTDAGLEFVLDCIEWQIRQVLADESCPWADWFRQFAMPDMDNLTSTRGALRDKDTNVPFAGREISIPLAPSVRDPLVGEQLGELDHWSAFLELLATDENYQAYREQFLQIAGTGVEDWRSVYRLAHMHSGTLAAFGLKPTNE